MKDPDEWEVMRLTDEEVASRVAWLEEHNERCREEGRKICFYCFGLVAERHGQGDHFPIPKRAGGTLVIPCCTSCHDMKDRFPLDRWSMEWWSKVMADWPNMSRETRIFIGKVASIWADELAKT